MSRLSRAQIATVARKAGFPESAVPVAVAVALAESGGNPNATHTNSNGSHDYGLFQINTVHAALLKSHNWRDPQQNADMAFQIWKDAGKKWTPWATFNHGTYRKFYTGTAPGNASVPTTGNDTSNNSEESPVSSADALAGSPITAVTGMAAIATQLTSTTFWKRLGIGALAVLLIIAGIIIVFRQPIKSATINIAETVVPEAKAAGMALNAVSKGSSQ